MSRDAVREFVERTASELAAADHGDRAEALRAALARPQRAKPAVFVVGEDKRGKSCLANALLAAPGLSPVGVEVVTGAPITFFKATPRTAMIFKYGESKPIQVEFEHARSLATVAGNPGNVENIRAVALGIDHPLLDQINLIDTPGVGGLDSGHGNLTLQSMHGADALIFVMEAGAQLRGPELEFLRRAAARVDTVILTLSKVDMHRGWRTIRDDNRRILEEVAPRLARCPLVPISSTLALRAQQVEDRDDAAELLQESGLVGLLRAIAEHVIARGTLLGTRNLVRAAGGELTVIEREVQEQLAGLDGTGSRATLEAEQARLNELRQSRSEWSQRLDLEVRRLSLERSEEATRHTLEIKRHYDERLRRLRPEDIDTLPGELVADLAALAGSLNERAVERLASVAADVLSDIDAASRFRETLTELTHGSLQSDLERFQLGSYGLATSDKLSVLSSFASGRSLGALGGATVGVFVAPPLGLAVGFAVGGLFAFQAFRSRGQHAFTAAFQPWMAAQISQTLVAINTTFARRMLDLQGEIRSGIQEAIARREAEIASSLEATQKLLEVEEGRRRQAEQGLHARLAGVQALRHEAAALLRQLDAETAADPAAAATRGAV